MSSLDQEIVIRAFPLRIRVCAPSPEQRIVIAEWLRLAAGSPIVADCETGFQPTKKTPEKALSDLCHRQRLIVLARMDGWQNGTRNYGAELRASKIDDFFPTRKKEKIVLE